MDAVSTQPPECRSNSKAHRLSYVNRPPYGSQEPSMPRRALHVRSCYRGVSSACDHSGGAQLQRVSLRRGICKFGPNIDQKGDNNHVQRHDKSDLHYFLRLAPAEAAPFPRRTAMMRPLLDRVLRCRNFGMRRIRLRRHIPHSLTLGGHWRCL
jgi:hypothetical protein